MNAAPPMRPWPDRVLPVPTVLEPIGTWRETGGQLVFDRENLGMRRIPLPDQFWLQELLDLDLQSADAIVKFSNLYGMLDAGTSRAVSAARTLEEFRADAVRTRNTARVVLALLGDSERDYFGELEDNDRPEYVFMPDGSAAPGQPSTFELLAAGWAARNLNRGLTPMHPRIVVADDPISEMFSGSEDWQVATLFQAVSVQIFNYTCTREHLSRCEWSTCGRDFTYQRGRSKYGGHKANARYCSPQCMRAAKQKRYRDEKRKGGETK